MINKDEARIEAWVAISDLFGNDYFRSHFVGSCEAYSDDDDVEYFYFLGFEDDGELWTVFASTIVNRETKEVTFWDYRTPDGVRMKNPPIPVRSAVPVREEEMDPNSINTWKLKRDKQ